MINRGRQRRDRLGMANALIAGLLAAILVAIVGLIVVLLAGKPVSNSAIEDGESGSSAGQVTNRGQLAKAPKSPKTVGNPDQIRDTLRTGKAYRVVVKGGFDARVEDKDYGVKQVTNLAYAVEMVLTRHIESNDGKRVVELRHFETCRNVKLLCDVEGVVIELGLPGTLLLGAIGYLQPGAPAAIVSAQPIVESILETGARAIANDQALKAVAHVESISGKKVRITYVDGVGVESIEPVDCDLSPSERDFVFNAAVLSDCYILPDVKSKPGQTWNVDGSQFSAFLDPSTRGIPEGEIEIRRGQDAQIDGKTFATLGIVRGFLELNASDLSARRVGSFTPRGQLQFNISDGYISKAELVGDLVLEEISKDHILFEARFHTRPRMKVTYSCELK